jgi:hypothetical protein
MIQRVCLISICAVACGPKEPESHFATAAGGVEECDNGRDDDGDGLADCEDADCLEVFTCAHAGETFQSQVLAGAVSWERVFERPDWEKTQAVEVTDIVGTLRILGDGGATTCDWSLDRAWMTHTHGATYSFMEVAPYMSWQREGLTVDPACDVSSAAFVPPALFAYGAVSGSTLSFRTSAYGAPWYFGYGEYSLETTRYYNNAAYAEVIGWSHAAWTAELGAGASYSFTVGE